MTGQGRRFRVALSFPGEKRAFVSQVADHLSQALGQDKVLYDAYYEAELARLDLDLYLAQIYHDDSELVVPFFCADYDRKNWCKFEWRQMRDVLFKLEGHRIMPFRFDNTPIPGTLSIDGYIDIGKRSPREVAELILQRLSGTVPPTSHKVRVDFLSSNVREAPQATNPGTLLNARYEIVPFFDEARSKELADLKAWCESDEPATSVRLFFGPGGTGKTRLMIEWAKQSRDQGWYAGFLPDQVNGEQIEGLLHADKPTFAVIDYAECRTGLHELLKQLAERQSEQKQRLRVALLAREVADWWQSLLQRDEAVRDLLMQAEPTLIAPVALEESLRQRVWEHARDAFANRLKKAIPSNTADLDDPRFGRILYLHMSALATVEGFGTKAESLLDEIVVHEKHFWAKRYQEQFSKDDFEAVDFDKRCSRLVAAITLQGGVPSKPAADELNRRVEGPAPRYEHLVALLRSLYPGREKAGHDRYIGSLEPDLLGEALVWSVLTDPENTAEAFLERAFTGANEMALRNGFVVLGRISLQDASVAEPWLASVLEADITGRARPAFLAALALGSHTAFSPLGQILTRVLERGGTVDHATQFDSLVPHHTVSLRELGVWTGRRLLEFLTLQEGTQENLAGRGHLLNNLSNRLSDLGRREEALKAAQEAVDIYRRLAKNRPYAFLPDLAMSLNNLGLRLSDVGWREEALRAAQEAADIHRRLAKDLSEAFRLNLAASLNSVGNGLCDLARWEEALNAAQEAVNISRELAKDRSEASRLSLAASLNNLGTTLSGLGRREEALKAAQEATDIYRRLAKGRPDAFLPYVVMSMNNLANRLRDLGRPEEALKAAQDSIAICRRLAKDRPDAFAPDLARYLGTLGMCLVEAARLRDAVDAFAEGVRILTPAFCRLPQAFAPLMGHLVSDYLTHVKELGEQPDMDLLGPVLAKLEEIKDKR